MRILIILLVSSLPLLAVNASVRTVVVTHSGPPLSSNAQSTAIDGGTKTAELQTSPGYYLLEAVAVPITSTTTTIQPSGSVH
jgi:hypothetical protein